MISLSNALSQGQLAQCRDLRLTKNKISDFGMVTFSKALDEGALPELEKLCLFGNEIGDVGITAFAKAITPDENGEAAVALLERVCIGRNSFTDAAKEHLKSVCHAPGIEVLECLLEWAF